MPAAVLSPRFLVVLDITLHSAWCCTDAEPVQILNNVTVESKHGGGVKLGEEFKQT